MTIKTVFLSSTGRDLADYREAAFRAIDGLDDYKCIRMESYGAVDDAPVDLDLRKIEGCDLFVGLMGLNYGSCPPGDEKSFTEHEYDDAVGKPRLMFVAPDRFPVPGNLRETDEEFEKQQVFRKRVMSERVVAKFESPERLATQIVQSIHEWASSQAAAPSVTSAATIPLPPNPYFAHPYAMQPNFTGRMEERRMLSGWWRDGAESVLAPHHPSISPDFPEGREGDESLEAVLDAADAAFEQRCQAAQQVAGSLFRRFFSPGVALLTTSHMPTDTAQNSASAMTRTRRPKRSVRWMWLSSIPKPRVLKSENMGSMPHRSP